MTVLLSQNDLGSYEHFEVIPILQFDIRLSWSRVVEHVTEVKIVSVVFIFSI